MADVTGPGPAPDLTDYDTTASAAAHEWFLSDHPWAVAERTRRRLAWAARGQAHAAATREWADRTRAADDAGQLAGRPDGWRDNLVALAKLMGPIADRSQLEAVLDEVTPDEAYVAEERRFWETHIRVSVDGPEDYTYPTHLTGPGAAAYPPPPEGFPAPQRRRDG